MVKEKRNLYEERARAKLEWLYWQNQIGTKEFCADKEHGLQILENSKNAYKKLVALENEIRTR